MTPVAKRHAPLCAVYEWKKESACDCAFGELSRENARLFEFVKEAAALFERMLHGRRDLDAERETARQLMKFDIDGTHAKVRADT